LNQNARKAANQPSQPFEKEKEDLFETLRNVNVELLSLEQISFLKELEVYDYINESAIDIINDILLDNTLDIATAVNKINEIIKIINQSTSKLKSIQTTLFDAFNEDFENEVPEGHILMRIYFKDGVAINNLSDFKKLSSVWYDIGRGIAMAQDKAPEDFKIIGAQTGSVIINLAVAVGIAKSVSFILLRTLKVAERFIEVLKKVEELKYLKLNNKKIELDLKKEAEEEKEKGIKSIIEAVIKELQLNPEKDGEKISALDKAINKLVDFTRNGGLVDFVQPTEDDESTDKTLRKEIEKLKENMSEIRLLENKLKKIGNSEQK